MYNALPSFPPLLKTKTNAIQTNYYLNKTLFSIQHQHVVSQKFVKKRGRHCRCKNVKIANDCLTFNTKIFL